MQIATPVISIKELFRYGYQTTKQHFWQLCKLELIIFGITIAMIGMIGALLKVGYLPDKTTMQVALTNYPPSQIILLFGLLLLQSLSASFVLLTFCKAAITLHDTGNLKTSKQFPSLKVTFYGTLLHVLAHTLTTLGTLLFIVPGIILGVYFYFWAWVFVDNPEQGVIASLKESMRISKGNRLKILLFSIIAGLVSGSGILLFGIGVLFTLPIGLMAGARLYRTLKPRIG